MKYTLLFLICLNTFINLNSATAAEPKSTDTLIINDPEWPPFFFAGKNPKKQGFAKEILSLCFDELKLDSDFSYFPLKRMLVGLQEGSVDLNIFSFRENRVEFLSFGKEPLFELSYQPVVRADSDISIKTLADFDKHRLGHQIGFQYSDEFYRYIENRRKKGTLDETHSNTSNFQKLLANRIDIFVSTTASIGSVSKEMGITDKIKVLDFVIIKANYFITISKKSLRIRNPIDFLANMDGCIKRLKKDGTYCKKASDYGVICPT